MRLIVRLRNLTLVLAGVLPLLVLLTPEFATSSPAMPPPSPILQNPGSKAGTNPNIDDQLWLASRVNRERAWYLSLGYLSGKMRESAKEQFWAADLSYQMNYLNETADTVSLMLASERLWGMHIDRSHYCCMGDWAEAYGGYGVGSFWKTNDSISSFADVQSYHLRGHFGFENLLNLERRLRAEFVLRLSPAGLSGEILMGYTFAP